MKYYEKDCETNSQPVRAHYAVVLGWLWYGENDKAGRRDFLCDSAGFKLLTTKQIMNTRKIEVGTKFFYGGLHTIEHIDDFKVLHSYTYTNAKGEKVEVHDAFMYRSVFDKLVEMNVINILNK